MIVISFNVIMVNVTRSEIIYVWLCAGLLSACSVKRNEATSENTEASHQAQDVFQFDIDTTRRVPSKAIVANDGLYYIRPFFGYKKFIFREEPLIKSKGNDEVVEVENDVEDGPESWMELFGPTRIWASSVLSPSGKANYEAANLFSDNGAWCEGVEGNGIGESVSIEFPGKGYYGPYTVVNTLTILNGYSRSRQLWNDNGRVKTLKLYVDNIPYAYLELLDTLEYQTFDLGRVFSRSGVNFILKFEIIDVYPGAKYDDVALSEFEFNGEGHLCLEASTEISMSDGTTRSIEELKEGDWIISVDPNSKEVVNSQVLNVAVVPHNNLVEIWLDEGVIRLTDDHPLLTIGGEWAVVKPINKTGCVKLVSGTTLAFINNGETKGAFVREIVNVKGIHFTYSIVHTSTDLPFLSNGLLTSIGYSKWGAAPPNRIKVLEQP